MTSNQYQVAIDPEITELEERERKRSNIIFPSMIPYPSPRMIEGATFLPYFFFSITSSLCKILYSCKRGGGMSCIEYKIGFSLSNAFWPCNVVRFTEKFELLDNWNWKLWGHWQQGESSCIVNGGEMHPQRSGDNLQQKQPKTRVTCRCSCYWW